MVVDVIANILLVPFWGFWGAGIACFLTYLSRSIFALILSLKKSKGIRYNYIAIYVVPMSFFALTFVNWLFVDFSFLTTLVIKISFCVVLIIGFYLLFREQIQTLVNAKRNTY